MSLPEVDQERDHIVGAPTARITLVEYGDFECPFCRQASPMVRILRSHFGDGLRFVYRHFPQPEVHPYALSAAVDLTPGATKAQLMDAMKGHILAEGQLVGNYGR